MAKKKPIVSKEGQWKYPGQETIIPNANGRITMQGVPYPVFGIDDLGYSQMMMPGAEYQFPGNSVYEIPMAKNGGTKRVKIHSLPKAQNGEEVTWTAGTSEPWEPLPEMTPEEANQWAKLRDDAVGITGDFANNAQIYASYKKAKELGLGYDQYVQKGRESAQSKRESIVPKTIPGFDELTLEDLNVLSKLPGSPFMYNQGTGEYYVAGPTDSYSGSRPYNTTSLMLDMHMHDLNRGNHYNLKRDSEGNFIYPGHRSVFEGLNKEINNIKNPGVNYGDLDKDAFDNFIYQVQFSTPSIQLPSNITDKTDPSDEALFKRKMDFKKFSESLGNISTDDYLNSIFQKQNNPNTQQQILEKYITDSRYMNRMATYGSPFSARSLNEMLPEYVYGDSPEEQYDILNAKARDKYIQGELNQPLAKAFGTTTENLHPNVTRRANAYASDRVAEKAIDDVRDIIGIIGPTDSPGHSPENVVNTEEFRSLMNMDPKLLEAIVVSPWKGGDITLSANDNARGTKITITNDEARKLLAAMNSIKASPYWGYLAEPTPVDAVIQGTANTLSWMAGNDNAEGPGTIGEKAHALTGNLAHNKNLDLLSTLGGITDFGGNLLKSGLNFSQATDVPSYESGPLLYSYTDPTTAKVFSEAADMMMDPVGLIGGSGLIKKGLNILGDTSKTLRAPRYLHSNLIDANSFGHNFSRAVENNLLKSGLGTDDIAKFTDTDLLNIASKKKPELFTPFPAKAYVRNPKNGKSVVRLNYRDIYGPSLTAKEPKYWNNLLGRTDIETGTKLTEDMLKTHYKNVFDAKAPKPSPVKFEGLQFDRMKTNLGGKGSLNSVVKPKKWTKAELDSHIDYILGSDSKKDNVLIDIFNSAQPREIADKLPGAVVNSLIGLGGLTGLALEADDYVNPVIQKYAPALYHKLGLGSDNLLKKHVAISLNDEGNTLSTARVNDNSADGNVILGGEFIFQNPNTVNTPEWFKNNPTVQLGDPSSDYGSVTAESAPGFWGVENGKIKAGPLNEFAPDTKIVPMRPHSNAWKPIGKAGSVDGHLRFVDRDNNIIYNNAGTGGKILLYSPTTKAAHFVYNTGDSEEAANTINNLIAADPDLRSILLDNGRYSHYIDKGDEKLDENDFKDYTSGDVGNPGNPGFNLVLKRKTSKKLGGVINFRNGGQLPKAQFGPPTASDSAMVANKANEVGNWLVNHGYKQVNSNPANFSNPAAFKQDLESGIRRFTNANNSNNIIDFKTGTRGRFPGNYTMGYTGHNPVWQQRDMASGVLNPDAPASYYDTRILPQRFDIYDATNQFGNYDSAGKYTYEKLAVTPWKKLTTKQKIQRLERYGTSGSPYKDSKVGIKELKAQLQSGNNSRVTEKELTKLEPKGMTPIKDKNSGIDIKPQLGIKPIKSDKFFRTPMHTANDGVVIRVHDKNQRFIGWEDEDGNPIEIENPTGSPTSDFDPVYKPKIIKAPKFQRGGDISIPDLKRVKVQSLPKAQVGTTANNINSMFGWGNPEVPINMDYLFNNPMGYVKSTLVDPYTPYTVPNEYYEILKRQESAAKDGYRDGKYYPYKSPEGGNYTIGYGHKLTDKDVTSGRFKNGITDKEVDNLFHGDVDEHLERAKQRYDAAHGKGAFSKLHPELKTLALDFTYNGIDLSSKDAGYPKFWGAANQYSTAQDEALKKQAYQIMLNNYVRNMTDPKTKKLVPLGERNKYTLDVLNNLKKTGGELVKAQNGFNASYDFNKSPFENAELNRRAQAMGWNSVADYEKSGWGQNQVALKQRALINNPQIQEMAKIAAEMHPELANVQARQDQLYANKTSGAQKTLNQVYYGLSNPLDALGQYSKYGYVPQGNVGNYGFKDDSAGPISLANATFNPFAWGNAAYRFANEVSNPDSWTTGRGAVNMTTDFLEALPFFSEVSKAAQPALRFAANTGSNLVDNAVNTATNAYNKVATGNSFIDRAWKVERPNFPIKSTDYIARPNTDAEIALLDKYGRGMSRLTPEEWAQMENLTRSGATDFSKGKYPISRIIGYYNRGSAENKLIEGLKVGDKFHTPTEKTIRTWSVGTPGKGDLSAYGNTRLVIPSKYTKGLGNNFGAMPYNDKRLPFIWNPETGEINSMAVAEKEIMGNLPKGFKVIGTSNENGVRNLIIKPLKEGGQLPKAQNGIPDWQDFLRREMKVAPAQNLVGDVRKVRVEPMVAESTRPANMPKAPNEWKGKSGKKIIEEAKAQEAYDALPEELKRRDVLTADTRSEAEKFARRAWTAVSQPMETIAAINKGYDIPSGYLGMYDAYEGYGVGSPMTSVVDGVAGLPGFIGNAAYRQGEQIVDNPLEYALVNTLGLLDPDTRDRAVANYLDLTAVIPSARVASGPLASGIRSAGQALKPIKQKFIYNAVDPVGYGMGQKIVMAPETFYKNITNPSGRPERIGSMLVPNTADPANFDIGQLGRNRLDAWAKYLGTKENYGIFQPNYEGQFTFHAPVSPLKFASLYNDILAAKIKNSNAGVYFKDDLVELTRNFNKVMYGDPSTTTYKLNRFLDERGMTKPWEQTRKAGKSNVEGFDDIVFDYDENAVMGGHHYKVTKTPEGYLHFQANDTWDLHPFGKRGNANVIDDDFTKAMQEQHYVKSLRNLEMGKILGGKPFDIKINYLVDPKTFKTIKTWREGGQTHKLQKGGPAYNIPEQPYRNPKIVREEGREYYDPHTETIYMRPSYPNVIHEAMVQDHEMEHHKQKLDGRLSSTEYWPGPLKEPASPSSDDMIAPYYNRTTEDVFNIIDSVPPSTLFGIPQDVTVPGFQYKTYDTPGTAEYEAEYADREPRTLRRGNPVIHNAVANAIGRGQVDPEMMFRDRYNTPLTPEEEKAFNEWAAKESKRQGRDILMDKGAYDIQGFWKSGDFKKMDADNHGTDTWKKPNHPTFSTYSKYHGADGRYGGKWTQEAGYQPSKQTLDNYGLDYYNWLFGNEPDRLEHLDMSRYDGENIGSPIIYKQGGSVKRVKINTLPKNWKTK